VSFGCVADDEVGLDAQALRRCDGNSLAINDLDAVDILSIAEFSSVLHDRRLEGPTHCHAAALGVVSAVQVVADPREDKRRRVQLTRRKSVVRPQGGEHGGKLLGLDVDRHEFLPTLAHGSDHVRIGVRDTREDWPSCILPVVDEAPDIEESLNHRIDE